MSDLKNRTRFTNTLRNDLLDKLKEISTETDVPISKLLDRAIELLLQSMKNKQI